MANTQSSKSRSTHRIAPSTWAEHINAITERNRFSRELERYAFRGMDEDDFLPDDEHAIVFAEGHPAERLLRLKALRRAKGIERRRATLALKRRHHWNLIVTHADHIRARAMGVVID